ncbi:MAG: cation:proton antiporter, partial [Chloroflexota bacterium]
MGHLPGLISDLALILITGAITTILFRKIKQPLVLGYIIAGFLVGPHIAITPTITDTVNVKTWADIGVIFLLFSLGLEFSFRKLRRIGGSASITAITEIIFILVTGYLLGISMGWPQMDSIFLGGMLASSSTTIISKAFDELGVKTQKFAGVVIGVLIVEDLVVIMIMVLLSTVAVTREIQGVEMLMTILKLLVFLVLWFVAGIFIIPTLLKKARKLLNEETLLILSIGLCLVMVVLATKIGFSAELGAFIMGSILAETTSAEKIEHLVRPVKDLFGAVFFVSVGMLIDPALIVEYRWPILWVSLLVLFGKLISTTAGALISGQPLKQSVQVGMSMAQVGEFAFIVASLGLSLGVTSDFLFPVAVGVSAITTFTTPYMIRFSPVFEGFIHRKLPESWIERLNRYSSGTQEIQTESSWKKVIKSYISIVLTNSLIVIALFIISIEMLLPLVSDKTGNSFMANLIVLAVSLIAASPFLWAIMAKQPAGIREKEVLLDIKYRNGPLFIIGTLRIITGVLLVGFLLDRMYSATTAFLIGMPIIILAVIFSSRSTKLFHGKLEKLFLGNLNARDEIQGEKTAQSSYDHLQ